MISINLLPKNLRRVREPGYWRFIAIIFPLVVLGVIVALQFFAQQTVNNLEQEKQTRADTLALLQPALREQRELRQRLEQLGDLIAIRNDVRENRIVWSSELTSMLETLPAQGNAAQPRIDFQNLNMQAINPPQADEDRFEGRPVVAEMTVSGNVIDTEVLSEFIRALENSESFGVVFQNASRQEDSGLYTYNLTIGALTGESDVE